MAASPKTLLSTFSGLGGLDLGLEAAGYQTLGCIEFNATARESLRANRPGWKLIEPNDIILAAKALQPSDLGVERRDLFMLSGGPPCQPFSKAAQWSSRAMQGLKDPRSQCLSGFIKLIDTLLPHVILIENVQGFVTGKNNALQKLKNGLRKINRENKTKYRLTHTVVDAADYGVPQKRLRAILLAHRDGIEINFPKPTSQGSPVSAWEAFSDISMVDKKLPCPGKWGQLLPSIPEGKNYLWHTSRGGGSSLFGYRTRFWSFLLKLAKNQPAWTIPAQPGPYTGPFHWENRPLTKIELLRIQSFPENWKVEGNHREVVRQIGNATPPLLAEIIGRTISSQLLQEKYSSPPKLAFSRASSIPASETVSEIPTIFRKHIKKRAAHPGTGLGPCPIKS